MERKEQRTERLVLRPFQAVDLGDLYEFLSQLKDDEFEGCPGLTRENCTEQLEKRIGSDAFFAIDLKEAGKVIDNLYCGDRAYQGREVGYIINEKYRRHGYAEEALSAVVRAAFGSGAHRVYAECDPRNERSWRLLEKAGFRRETHFRQNLWFHTDADGRPVWKDTYVYAMLREDMGSA